MDAIYFDLFIKYKDAEEEIVWDRALTWAALGLNLKMIEHFNQTDIKLFGKSRVEYLRIE